VRLGVSDKCHSSLQIDQYDEILLCVFIIMNHHLVSRIREERVDRQHFSVMVCSALSLAQEL
jgi:hypothetical protein